MDRRKDTEYRGERLPKEYMEMIRDVLKVNFKGHLQGKGKNREVFVVFGEIYPDELLLAVSLKNPANLRMTTCYGSMDFPPPSIIPESGNNAAISAPSVSEAVQTAVSQLVDVIGSFFNTYFEEGRPVDYDEEYRQDWTVVEVEKTTKVYVRLNRDNLELEAASDDFLAQHEAMVHRDELVAEEVAEENAAEAEEAEESEEDTESESSGVATEEMESAEAETSSDESEESEAEAEEEILPGEPLKTGKTKKKTVH